MNRQKYKEVRERFTVIIGITKVLEKRASLSHANWCTLSNAIDNDVYYCSDSFICKQTEVRFTRLFIKLFLLSFVYVLLKYMSR